VNGSRTTATWSRDNLRVEVATNTAVYLDFSAAADDSEQSLAPVAPLRIWVAAPALLPVLVAVSPTGLSQAAPPALQDLLGTRAAIPTAVYRHRPLDFVYAVVGAPVVPTHGATGSETVPSFQAAGDWRAVPFGDATMMSSNKSTGTSSTCVLQAWLPDAAVTDGATLVEATVDAAGWVTAHLTVGDSVGDVCGAWLQCSAPSGPHSSELHLFRIGDLALQLAAATTSLHPYAVVGGADLLRPFADTVSVRLFDSATHQPVADEVATGFQCVMTASALPDAVSVVSADGGPEVKTLTTVPVAEFNRGLATFYSPALIAAQPLELQGDGVNITISCVLASTGLQLSLELSIPVLRLAVDWWPSAPSLALLLSTPLPIASRIMVAAATSNSQATAAAHLAPYNASAFGNTFPTCELQLSSTSSSSLAPISLDRSLDGITVAWERSAGSGDLVARLQLSVTGSYGESASVAVVCSVGGLLASTLPSRVTLQQVIPALSANDTSGGAAAISAVMLPSSAEAAIAVEPAPIVRFYGSVDGMSLAGPETVCVATVSRTGASDTAVEDAAAIMDPSPGYAWSPAADAVVISPLFVQPQWPHWGVTTPLLLECSRRTSEQLRVVPWSVATPNVSAHWVVAPPKHAVNVQPFDVSAVLLFSVSRSVFTAAPTAAAVAAGARFLTCNLDGSASVARSAVAVVNTELIGGASVISHPMVDTATLFALAVNLSSVSIAALPGSIQPVQMRCNVGSIPLPASVAEALTAAVVSLGCPGGQRAAAINGIACVPCPSGTTSIVGGTANGTTAFPSNDQQCLPCPHRGVSCVSGQPAALLPGFYPTSYLGWAGTAASSASMLVQLASDLDFVECPNPQACVVGTTDSSFACAAGYTGPLCGSCVHGHYLVGAECKACPSTPVAAALLFLLMLSAACLLCATHMTVTYISVSARHVTAWRIAVDLLTTLGLLSMTSEAVAPSVRESLAWLQALLLPGAGDSLLVAPLACSLRLSAHSRLYCLLALPVLASALCAAAANAQKHVPRRLCCRGVDTSAALQNGGRPPSTPVALAHPSSSLHQAVCVGACAAYGLCPTIVAAALRTFRCTPERFAGVAFLTADLSLPCGGGSYTAAAAVAGIVLVALAIGLIAWLAVLARMAWASASQPLVPSRAARCSQAALPPRTALEGPLSAQPRPLLMPDASSRGVRRAEQLPAVDDAPHSRRAGTTPGVPGSPAVASRTPLVATLRALLAASFAQSAAPQRSLAAPELAAMAAILRRVLVAVAITLPVRGSAQLCASFVVLLVSTSTQATFSSYRLRRHHNAELVSLGLAMLFCSLLLAHSAPSAAAAACALAIMSAVCALAWGVGAQSPYLVAALGAALRWMPHAQRSVSPPAAK
jgi:hypothetical protein